MFFRKHFGTASNGLHLARTVENGTVRYWEVQAIRVDIAKRSIRKRWKEANERNGSSVIQVDWSEYKHEVVNG